MGTIMDCEDFVLARKKWELRKNGLPILECKDENGKDDVLSVEETRGFFQALGTLDEMARDPHWYLTRIK